MLATLVFWWVVLVQIYLAAGLLFAVPFVARGVGSIDPVAAQGSWGFRLAILPGCVALWPLLVRRWLRSVRAEPERASAGSGGVT